jgi:signal transduction histidine kinase
MDEFDGARFGPRHPPAGQSGTEDVDPHVGFRDIVLDTSTSLMSAKPDEFETKLRWGLENVGKAADVDRGYVFRANEDVFELTDEWTAPGVDSKDTRRVDMSEFVWLADRLERFENVVVSRTADLDPKTRFREMLGSEGVGGAVVVPMVSDWSLEGFVGFEVMGSTRSWTSTEVGLLRTTSDMISHSFARVERERTLAEQNDRLETFASVVSHDLRNPLNVVSGSIDLARKQHEGDSKHLKHAAQGAERMQSIIDEMLTLAREGEDIGEIELVSIEEIIKSAWRTVDIGDARLEIDGEIEVDRGDPDRLQEAFENLFRNAIEHGSATPHVRVGATENGFYVVDDGPGIPPGERDAVFDRGYSNDDGTGLGLAVVRRVFEAHGWSVEIGDAENAGARFEVDCRTEAG